MKSTSENELQSSSTIPAKERDVMMEFKIGDPAPDFKATAVGGIYGGGQNVKLADFADSTLVLYFLPAGRDSGVYGPGM